MGEHTCPARDATTRTRTVKSLGVVRMRSASRAPRCTVNGMAIKKITVAIKAMKFNPKYSMSVRSLRSSTMG